MNLDEKNFSLQILKSKQGMALAQVLIFSALISSLAISLLVAFSNNFSAQKKLNIQNNLSIMRDQIKNLILDSSSWTQTVNIGDNTVATDCLRNFSSVVNCNHSAAAPLGPNDLVLIKPNTDFENANYPLLNVVARADGSVFMISANIAGNPGFTDQGAPCDAFNDNPAIGNPDCPIRWSVRIQYLCPSGSTCRNPEVRFVVLLYYHPGPNPRPEQLFNQNRFRLVLTRGETGPLKNETFEANYGNSTNSTGGGICTPNNWVPIVLNQIQDSTVPANATLISGGDIRLTAGTYNCSATTSCFECGAVAVRIFDQSGNRVITTSGTALAGLSVLAQAEIRNFKFTVNSDSRIALQHYCQAIPAFPNASYSMGMPVQDYTYNKFATIRCSRLY